MPDPVRSQALAEAPRDRTRDKQRERQPHQVLLSESFQSPAQAGMVFQFPWFSSTTRKRLLPSLQTRNSTRLFFTFFVALTASSAVSTRFRLTSWIRSPGRRPASKAGESGATSVTSAPLRSGGRLNWRRVAASISPTPTSFNTSSGASPPLSAGSPLVWFGASPSVTLKVFSFP